MTTFTCPFPLRSLLGQEQMGDGLLYWFLMSGFSLSNILIIKLYPDIAKNQLQGLLIGGMILALSIFPQAFNWQIDYTITTGQLVKKGILVSSIFKHQQPIGLYSHRGHASFVLAAIGILALVSYQKRWLSSCYLFVILSIILSALILTQTRAGIMAFLGAVVYYFGSKYYKILIPIGLTGLLMIGMITNNRPSQTVHEITSGRSTLWKLSIQGIEKRPWLGWGFDGFGTAYPYINDSNQVSVVTRIGNFSFDYLDKTGKFQRKPLLTTKAHNLILDTTLSVGILGILLYLTLLGVFFKQVIHSPYCGIEALAIAYLVFTITWFECAQFTHLFWWSLIFWSVTSKPRDKKLA